MKRDYRKENKYMTIKEIHKKDVKIWEHQRVINQNRVEELKQKFLDNHKNKGNLCLRHPILMCKFKGDLKIIDGQHRYEALKSLFLADKIPNKKIEVGIIPCYSEEDIRWEFENINNVKPIQLSYLQPNALLKKAMNHLKVKYPNIRKFNRNHQRPSFDVDELETALMENKIIKKHKIKEVEDVVEMFDNLQDHYKKQDFQFFINKARTKPKTMETFRKRMKDDYHLLGYFKKSELNLIIDDLEYANNLLPFK